AAALQRLRQFMRSLDLNNELGEPDIKIAGLSIWLHQRQFPEADDYDDANWLIITACCKASGAVVWINGPIIHLSEIYRLLKGCEQMSDSLSGAAELGCMEPELALKLKMLKNGQMEMDVEISPDHLTQTHQFRFDIDQSYLPNLIRDCRQTLDKYPIKPDRSETE
ncbi:MAG TPA: hypothetical protein VFY40_11255, partial [Blastocatellia bacterium]|nr:hypothetical protein [Blastocatellia bacterium]